MRVINRFCLVLMLFCGGVTSVLADAGTTGFPVTVTDDTGNEVTLASEPTKIISLAPHLTEILFGLNVGNRIVATVDHSDYPEAASQIPRLGSAFAISLEAVVALDPDLVVAWSTGGNSRTVERIRSMGYAVYINEAETLGDIATTIKRLGILVGKAGLGDGLANEFTASLADINASNGESDLRVFFQIADEQLYTINNEHLIGQAITVCRANNVFGDLPISVPVVSLESVVDANPDILLMARPKGAISRWESEWRRLGWGDRIRYLDASLVTRPSQNMAKGIKSLCKVLTH